jgi:hypothetical protein
MDDVLETGGLKKEVLTSEKPDLHIQASIWDSLRTAAEKGAENKREFLVFLLAKTDEPAASVAVPVGIGHGSGVSWSALDAIREVGPYLADGYRIVGDLHNHPDIPTYIAAGFPPEYTTGPSGADLISDEFSKVRAHFAQEAWPHTIVSFDGDSQTLHANTYRQNREATPEEEKTAEFEDPLFVPEESHAEKLKIVFHAAIYYNPEILVQNGVISLGDVHVHSNEAIEVIQNALSTIKPGEMQVGGD